MHTTVRLLILLVLSPFALAQGTFTQINVPGATGGGTNPSGINSAGQVSGIFHDRRGVHGFLLSDGSYTTIDYPGHVGDTYVYGINDLGQLVGSTSTFPVVGFLYDSLTGTFTEIAYPGATVTNPVAINNNGTIAGGAQIGQTVVGFQITGSSYTTISVPGALRTYVSGISDSGEVIGFFDNVMQNSIPFSYQGGTYRKVTVPGIAAPLVEGIDPAGDKLVGGYALGSQTTGFLFARGRARTLRFPGSTQTSAGGVNNMGLVVGYFIIPGQENHGFLWTPPSAPQKGH
ncbi:MAG: hypothetical protein H0X25_00865 [Acidobacteriales bacterium]|nr:hypothetical protein [Terriglobales bacterium]